MVPDVPVGTYVLSVTTPDYTFDHVSALSFVLQQNIEKERQLRIDVLDSEPTPEVRPYAIGTPLNPPSTILLAYPISLTPRQKHAYFVPHESFNLLAMLSNPMMLMMVVGGAMMLAMPYLMKNMDPEDMEEFKAQHAKVAGLQSAMTSGDLKSSLSAIMGGEDSRAAPVASQSPPATKRGNKNKRR
ncbi:hypothetical protein DXG01_000074 [Tephrocybe rancida]|nr:hypothetical protein DXG01_000074 [Tephrocybe rancida]